MRLAEAATMRALDEEAIQRIGIPGVVLMENAGRGTAERMLARWRPEMSGGVGVLCGRGNNGGDGFVIARHLFNAGIPVRVWVFAQRDSIQGDARVNLEIIERMGVHIRHIAQEDIWIDVRSDVLLARVLVDALLGTGLRSEVTGLLRRVIDDVNQLRRLVMAVDIPSGLDASSGEPHGVAVRATMTATYGLAKLGQVLEPALDYVGELDVVDISLPRGAVAARPEHDRLMEAGEVAALLPVRPFGGHKGTFGHLVVLAGSVGKVGAAVLACHAALRSGAGLVTLALPRSATSFLDALWPEVMLEPLDDAGTGHLVPGSLPRLRKVLEHKDALATGPGLSIAPGVADVLTALLKEDPLPKVIDADGLNALAGDLGRFRASRGPLILTPHPGEAARQLNLTTGAVQADRVGVVRAMARDTGAIVVLKGARSLTATPAGRLTVNPTGNPGMGTGGTGDVLTGLIGGLLAQRMDVESAAACGVFLHGLAGDLATAELGGRALVASDVVRHLGSAFRSVAGEAA